ncbi:MAG: methylenetetrahydrofolate reductase [Deltaproteobacteria bacterium]|nr:methylenetetrahydrofolate reductase [Deltaproteobacteria bacterium]MBW1929642.1 methylenetetrahydrofolate reductase [Deltaproteobacteria bacterium]MBW2025170.1 methylenetetrahydrofolate reductase [Deltaproteobacteria bacterium]MBW2126492.1 methylenetetrahydrofolate reductase [Deltaproteobacteria bacterium]RLB21922.1 MAG: methylenetetrahydrofolate reductase [Deltaproteobacteria bacterium]
MSEYKSGSNLEKVLKAGHFAFTGECGPPQGANVEKLREKAQHLKGMVDAVNVTDNQTAVVRMSSWAASLILLQEGLEPNFQMVCRDRNRLAMQSDILGVYAHGIRNMLCLSGDHQKFGNHPQSKNVYDIDSMQLIHMVKTMRDEGKFLNGEEIDVPPRLFIGAASNPFADPFDFRVYRLAKKIEAGADFIQTQCIYNMDKFREFMKRVVDMGLHEKCYILAGVTPMKSVGMARYMAKQVPGMDVPESLIKRLKGAGKGKAAEEGIKFAVEQIQEFKEMEGVAGVHLMAIEWEHRVPEIAEMAGMLPRPTV